MKKAQANKLGSQTVQKQLKKPIDGNNQVKSEKKKHIEQKKTSDLKNTVNTPDKEKENIESHTKTKSNLQTKNIELNPDSKKTQTPKGIEKGNKKELNKPTNGNNKEKSDKKKHNEQKKTSELKNTVNTPYKKKNIESPTKTKSNLLTKNIELSSQKRKVEDYSNTIRQNNFPKNNTTKNKLPKITINNSTSSNNNESSQLTGSVQGKPRLSVIKTTSITNKESTHNTNQTDKNNNIKKSNTMQENNRQRKIINNAITNTHINPDSKNIQTPKGIEKGNKSFNTGSTPKKQQNNNPLSTKSSKKILEGNKKEDIKIDETNNKKRTLTDGKTQEPLLNEEKKQQNVKSESKQGDLSNEIEDIEKNYKKQIDYINYFKPYYSVDIQKDLIQFSILLYQNESSIEEKKLICNDKNDYYEVVIKGKKEKPQQINGEMININYGSFRIESEIEKIYKDDNRKYKPEVKADNNGYVLVTFTPVI